MASYYSFNHQNHHPAATHPHSSSSHNNHGRSRRAPRVSASHQPHKQFRGVRSPRDMIESPVLNAARVKFEAARTFDLEDDFEFCQGLMTDDEIQSVHSSSTDGSLTSGSPDSSPLQPQIQPSQQVTPAFAFSSAGTTNYNSANGLQPGNNHNQQHHLNIHQPSALRTRNAIPIVNPNTGMRLPSPPSSVSPATMQQAQHQTSQQRRW